MMQQPVGLDVSHLQEHSHRLRCFFTAATPTVLCYSLRNCQRVKDNKLIVANKVFVAASLNLKSSHKNLTDVYSVSQLVNFARNKEVANIINSWFKQNTNNLIKELITVFVYVYFIHYDVKTILQKIQIECFLTSIWPIILCSFMLLLMFFVNRNSRLHDNDIHSPCSIFHMRMKK